MPSVTDSALAEVDMSPTSADLVPSVSDRALAQVDTPSPSDVPALDLTHHDENSDDDDTGDCCFFGKPAACHGSQTCIP